MNILSAAILMYVSCIVFQFGFLSDRAATCQRNRLSGSSKFSAIACFQAITGTK